jgi:hypothetical protein
VELWQSRSGSSSSLKARFVVGAQGTLEELAAKKWKLQGCLLHGPSKSWSA